METFEIIPHDVCSRKIIIAHENNIIKEVKILGGCAGNTQGVSRLLVGLTLEEAISRLKGIECPGSRTRKTSCPNELALGIEEYLHK